MAEIEPISVSKEDIEEVGGVIQEHLSNLSKQMFMVEGTAVTVSVGLTVGQLKKLRDILVIAEGNLEDAQELYELRTDVEKTKAFVYRYHPRMLDLFG